MHKYYLTAKRTKPTQSGWVVWPARHYLNSVDWAVAPTQPSNLKMGMIVHDLYKLIVAWHESGHYINRLTYYIPATNRLIERTNRIIGRWYIAFNVRSFLLSLNITKCIELLALSAPQTKTDTFFKQCRSRWFMPSHPYIHRLHFCFWFKTKTPIFINGLVQIKGWKSISETQGWKDLWKLKR